MALLNQRNCGLALGFQLIAGIGQRGGGAGQGGIHGAHCGVRGFFNAGRRNPRHIIKAGNTFRKALGRARGNVIGIAATFGQQGQLGGVG